MSNLLNGPPFVTGEPHVGHYLNLMFKNIISSYYGNKAVIRGFDCHGFPIESKMKSLAIPINKETCDDYVYSNINKWMSFFTKINLIPSINNYQTNGDREMRIIKNVFKILCNKNKVYKKSKVLSYSIGGNIILTNSESKEKFKMGKFVTAFVKFKLKDSDNCLVAFTTTPWNLPMNSSLMINQNLDYGIHENLISLKPFLAEHFNTDISNINSFNIKSLIGKEYIPLYSSMKITNPKIYESDYVLENNTGIVHMAPIHGQSDYEVFIKNNEGYDIPSLDILIDNKKYNIADFNTFNITETDKLNEKFTKDGHFLKYNIIEKEINICPRTNSMIINKLSEEVFLKLDKEKVLGYIENIKFNSDNAKAIMIRWVENAHDWCISRSNRSYGTELSFEGKECLFDCWFESACVPFFYENNIFKELLILRIEDLGYTYDQLKIIYPNGYEDDIKPIQFDYVLEGADQLQNWFYYLLYIYAALDSEIAPMKRIIVTGLVVDENKNKISKSANNQKISLSDITDYDLLTLMALNSDIGSGTNKYININALSSNKRENITINELFTIDGIYNYYTLCTEFFKQKYNIEYTEEIYDRYNDSTKISSKLFNCFITVLVEHENKMHINYEQYYYKGMYEHLKDHVTLCSSIVTYIKCILNNYSVEKKLHLDYLYLLHIVMASVINVSTHLIPGKIKNIKFDGLKRVNNMYYNYYKNLNNKEVLQISELNKFTEYYKIDKLNNEVVSNQTEGLHYSFKYIPIEFAYILINRKGLIVYDIDSTCTKDYIDVTSLDEMYKLIDTRLYTKEELEFISEYNINKQTIMKSRRKQKLSILDVTAPVVIKSTHVMEYCLNKVLPSHGFKIDYK